MRSIVGGAARAAPPQVQPRLDLQAAAGCTCSEPQPRLQSPDVLVSPPDLLMKSSGVFLQQLTDLRHRRLHQHVHDRGDLRLQHRYRAHLAAKHRALMYDTQRNPAEGACFRCTGSFNSINIRQNKSHWIIYLLGRNTVFSLIITVTFYFNNLTFISYYLIIGHQCRGKLVLKVMRYNIALLPKKLLITLLSYFKWKVPRYVTLALLFKYEQGLIVCV